MKQEMAFILTNGLQVNYTCDSHAKGMIFEVKVGENRPLVEGYELEKQFAMDHLIEHLIAREIEGVRNRACTEATYIRYNVRDKVEADKTAKILTAYTKLFVESLDKNPEIEKERIFEEMALKAHDEKDLQALGYIFNQGIPYTKEYAWEHKGELIDRLNRHADLVRSFSLHEIEIYNSFINGADKIVLNVSGPMQKNRFEQLLFASKLDTIPKCTDENPLINRPEVPQKTNYLNIDVSETQLEVPTDSFEQACDMCEIIGRKLWKHARNDLGIYICEPWTEGTNFVMLSRLTTAKVDNLKKTYKDVLTGIMTSPLSKEEVKQMAKKALTIGQFTVDERTVALTPQLPDFFFSSIASTQKGR